MLKDSVSRASRADIDIEFTQQNQGHQTVDLADDKNIEKPYKTAVASQNYSSLPTEKVVDTANNVTARISQDYV